MATHDDHDDMDRASEEPLSFFAYFLSAKILRDGEVQVVIQVPASNKYDIIKLTDMREKMWMFTAERPPAIETAEDLEKFFADFNPTFGEE